MIATDSSGTDESARLACGGLVVAFSRRDDRWLHDVAVERADGSQRVLLRWLDLRENDNPSVAVFQELSFRNSAPGSPALLVGQRSRHHDSASFELATDPEKGVFLEVDIASRITRGDRDLLACVYAVDLPVVDILEASPSRLRWTCRDPNGVLTATAGSGSGGETQFMVAEAGRRGTLLQPQTEGSANEPTRRCRFTLHWTST